VEQDDFDGVGMKYVTAIGAYEEYMDKRQVKENADVTLILSKIGCTNVEQEPSQQIWEKMIRIMLRNGQLNVEDFK
jgi:hypothetical protein